ncbi:MAG: protein kinase domain-containing protein [Thermoanaerobaculia bacterium]
MVKSGERVGAYEIIAPLGAGGMGVLFRARDPRLNREVAIKFLADKHSASDERLQRFDREARAASALNHPHIITVYEIGEHDGRPFIAMELVDGKSLRQLLTEGTLSMRKLLTIAGQIADGLAAAHDKGIVHRDLKPENVMITKTGYVKLLDFGLAKLEPDTVGPDDDTAKHELITTPGLVMGTAAYMSPEQARGHTIDYRSDQFSFGAVLFEMMTGKRPFAGSTPIDLIGSIVYQEPEKVSTLNPRVPNSVEWIVDRCLRKDRDDRYESTADLAREIELARDRMSDATPSAPVAPLAKAGSATRLVVAGVIVVLVLAALIGVWLAARHDVSAPRAGGGASDETIYLAVQPFRDVSPESLSPYLGEGFAQTISARLGGSGNVRVMEGPVSEPGRPGADDARAICRELGANRLLRGSLQRSGETLRVTYTITDASGLQVAGDSVEGAYADLFAIQDRLAEKLLETFGGAPPASGSAAGPKTFQQDRYLEAVGHLVRDENPASVDEAIEILSGLGDSPAVLATLARAYLAKRMIGDDPKYGVLATETCQRALATGERSAEIYTTLGEVNALVGKGQEAVEAFRAALSLQPDRDDAMIGLASALADGGNDQEAARIYRQAIALRPNLWVGHNHLGVFHLVRGRYEEALGAFNAAIALTPDNIRVLNNLGATYQQMGRHEEALRIYARSLAERPNADAYSNRGTCLFFMGRYDESADAFERATALNPDSWFIWVNLGDAYRWSTTRTAKARDAYARAIALGESDLALRPRDGNALAMLAASYAKSGDRRRAITLASMAIEFAPDDAYALYAAGVAFEVAGARERAVSAIEAALARGYSVEELTRDPELESLRNDKALAERLGEETRKGSG